MTTQQLDILDVYPFQEHEREYLSRVYEQLVYIGITEWTINDSGVNRYSLQLNHLLNLPPMYDRSDEYEELQYDLDDLEMGVDEPLESCFWFYFNNPSDGTLEFSVFYRHGVV